MKKYKEKLRRAVFALAAAVVAVSVSAACVLIAPAEVRAEDSDWPQAPDITAKGAVVLEMNTGVVLYEKNSHEQFYPASITKIMTTLLALENCSLDETVTFSEDAVYKNEGSTSNIARDLGEEMTVEETLYAIMLESANECAWAMAEHVAAKSHGTVTDFVQMMNDRAKELGCTDTNFHNPNGLPDTEHLTSAWDMSLIATAAYQNEEFRTITGTKQYTIPPTNKHTDSTILNNHHKCLNYYRTNEYLNPYVTGGKTGYTEAANATLVTYAENDGMAICVVVMNVDDPLQFSETNELIDYAFSNFSLCDASAMEDTLEQNSDGSYGLLNSNGSVLSFTGDSWVLLPNTMALSDLTAEKADSAADDSAVYVDYYYNDQKMGTAGIRLGSGSVQLTEYGNGITDRKILPVRRLVYAAAAIGALLLLILIRLIYVRIRRKQIRDERWSSRPTPQTLHKTALERAIREQEAAQDAAAAQAAQNVQQDSTKQSGRPDSGEKS